MQELLKPFQESRKVRAAAIALLTIIVTAILGHEKIDPDTVVNAIVLLASAYMGAVAWEDVATKKAMAQPTTTIETPAPNISVTATEKHE